MQLGTDTHDSMGKPEAQKCLVARTPAQTTFYSRNGPFAVDAHKGQSYRHVELHTGGSDMSDILVLVGTRRMGR